MPPKRVGPMLKRMRKKRGFTQDALAQKVGVHRVYIAQIEAQTKTPSLGMLERLAKALGVTTIEFTRGGAMLRLTESHIPTFLKIQLQDAAQGKSSYAEVGWHLGRYHIDTFDLDEDAVLHVSNADFDNPTPALRRLFASEDHPRADFVDLIPAKRRSDFLRGLVCGTAGYEFEDAKEFEWSDEGQ